MTQSAHSGANKLSQLPGTSRDVYACVHGKRLAGYDEYSKKSAGDAGLGFARVYRKIVRTSGVRVVRAEPRPRVARLVECYVAVLPDSTEVGAWGTGDGYGGRSLTRARNARTDPEHPNPIFAFGDVDVGVLFQTRRTFTKTDSGGFLCLSDARRLAGRERACRTAARSRTVHIREDSLGFPGNSEIALGRTVLYCDCATEFGWADETRGRASSVGRSVGRVRAKMVDGRRSRTDERGKERGKEGEARITFIHYQELIIENREPTRGSSTREAPV
ncbi:hypothetical protein BDW22DRAFT_1341729 [Trametopsis cervina]|nr:hypothetical protein BDW22DRAFT_1341729 [Trametopsis cervina]